MKLFYLSKLYFTYRRLFLTEYFRGVSSSTLKFLVLISSILVVSACSSTRTPTQPPNIIPDIAGSSETTTDAPNVKPRGILSDLKLCKMHISNPPSNIENLKSCVSGIELLVAPAPKACLSSGYGIRGGRQHRAIDYQSKPAGSVVAAGDGKIIEITFRLKDFGHWIIIDHGKGIYTSYAHMNNIEQGLKVGDTIKQGQKLGMMGETGGAAQAIHLHFELRQGDYSNPKHWWGLEPLNPFNQTASCS